jgi:hypothetical protein
MKVNKKNDSYSRSQILFSYYMKAAFTAASGVSPMQTTETSDRLFERPTTLTGKQGWLCDFTFTLIRGWQFQATHSASNGSQSAVSQSCSTK